MQPAIPAGTLLQNRYRILQLLGQGGFGRTYLAEDQGRFNERCAIKEFVPSQGEDRFSDKATELFQREAAILYQISHPQIPQFQATFEQDRRLFLVQDYVEGTTYRDLLNARRNLGKAFSETEIRQFLQQLLPVLAHIHAKGIIHRDVSPDNIILRRLDQLPVLIDFGVVKEVVTRLQSDQTAAPATTVGKIGYAPSEQMQTGRAYPSSDLYSLAVTAVVLLTGKEPQTLFDDVNLTWHWQPYAEVSPELAGVLNKALNYRPGDRYASVSQMVQALSGQVPSPSPTVSPTTVPGMPPPTPSATPLSELKTVAVGRVVPPPTAYRTQPGKTIQSTPVRPVPKPGLLENPIAIAAIGLGSAIVAGVGGWAVVNYLGSEPEPPSAGTIQPLPTPAPVLEASPTPVPPAAEPTTYDLPLELAAGDSKTVEGTVKSGDTVNYKLQLKAGETLTAKLKGEGVLLSVLTPQGEPPDDNSSRVFSWSGSVSEPGEYTIQLRPVQGLSRSDYQLEVTLAAAPPEPDPPEDDPATGENPDGSLDPDGAGNGTDDANGNGTDTGTDANGSGNSEDVQPVISEQRVQFPQGQTSTQVANGVGPGRIQRYRVNAAQGQIMTVKFVSVSGPATFAVLMPGGEPMADASGVLFWQSYLPLGGDYAIDVSSSSAAEFTLEVQVTGQGQ